MRRRPTRSTGPGTPFPYTTVFRSITLKLERARKLFDRDPAVAKRELENAEAVARHALAEVRSAVTGIRAADLAAELASARLMLESSGVHLDYDTPPAGLSPDIERRSEEHTSELQSLMRISYAVLCLKQKNNQHHKT